MTPSERILQEAKKDQRAMDFITIGGAGIASIVVEILAYLDEQDEAAKRP